MKESLFYASEELKRAEHLLYVSLKYTRTSDVMKSLIERLISCFDHIIEGMLRKQEELGVINEIPALPFAKADCLRNIHSSNTTFLDFMEFYSILRKILRSESFGANDFRRNVKMVARVDGKDIELTIDILVDYYHKTEEFLRYALEMR